MAKGDTKAGQVALYLSHTSRIIENWIRQGETEGHPVTKFESSDALRKGVYLKLSEHGTSDEDLFAAMEMILGNSVNPWTGRFVDKLYSAPLPLGIAAETLLSAINANAHVISASPMLCLAEEACVNSLAALCGWDVGKSDGLTMPGGSASNTLAIQTALNSLFPSFKQSGVIGIITSLMEKGRSAKASRPLIFTSQEAHYSIEKAAIACGLGLDCVVSVPCNDDGTMLPEKLDEMISQAITNISGTGNGVIGFPFFVNATAGTTVMGAFDALDRIAEVCERHSSQATIWKHVDGSWGAPVLFSQKYRTRMNGVELFDSMTICPHKMMNIPHQCSFAIFRQGIHLDNNALDAPYLFHDTTTSTSAASENGAIDYIARKRIRRDSPSKAAFGCGRRGDALKLYLVWLSKGSAFFALQVELAISYAQRIVSHIQADPKLSKLLEVSSRHGSSNALYAQVCFRPLLAGIEHATIENRSQATRHAHRTLQHQKLYAVDFAPLGGGQGDYIRLITHPGCKWEDLVGLVRQVALIGEEYGETLRNQ